MVPSRHPVRSARLREYAKELRSIADGMRSPDARQGVLQLAADYDAMAPQREQVEKAGKS